MRWHLKDRELEEIPEYNPNAWNEYPKVKPPKNVLMQVKIHKPWGVEYTCGIYTKGEWFNVYDGEPDERFVFEEEIAFIEFRPWGD